MDAPTKVRTLVEHDEVLEAISGAVRVGESDQPLLLKPRDSAFDLPETIAASCHSLPGRQTSRSSEEINPTHIGPTKRLDLTTIAVISPDAMCGLALEKRDHVELERKAARRN